MVNPDPGRLLPDIFNRLWESYGPQHWWPGDSPFEVIVGAIMTQSAAWPNVARAISNLKNADCLSAEKMRNLPQDSLARLIYSCGYYRAKAKKLKVFAEWLGRNYGDDLDRLFNREIPELRERLLSVYGIGEETADSITLYAGNKPVFVIDTYTRRIIDRIGLSPEKKGYGSYQRLFMDNLPRDAVLFNEYHALLVALGKTACRRFPKCAFCCLNDLCQYGRRTSGLSAS